MTPDLTIHEHVAVYIEGKDGRWHLAGSSYGSRVSDRSKLGDVRMWPPDEYVPVRQLSIDYDPSTFDVPTVLPLDLARSLIEATR